ncbi:MAG: hypothetical protein QOE82_3122 [Thermoanaerobaculia bacterium]|jgi:hypothetical protein|nr:hypothetical protein [Thermoanaerobaculia bacterium]
MAFSQLPDWIAETSASTSARLEAAKASQTQTRITLGVMAIISAMMLIACYNAYFSYDYRFLRDHLYRFQSEPPMHDKLGRPLAETPVSEALMSQAARDWAGARTIQTPLLGIRMSVDDAVLGVAILAMLSLWLVLVTRRENHTIGLLLRATDTNKGEKAESSPEAPSGKKYSDEQRLLIFHTIAANAIFETPDTSMVAISSLGGPDPLTVPVIGWKRLANDYSFRMIRGFFFLFPIITSVIVFCADRYSYFIEDPFDHNKIPGIHDAFFWPSLAFYVALLPLAVCCRKAARFSHATESVLREYCLKLRRDLS